MSGLSGVSRVSRVSRAIAQSERVGSSTSPMNCGQATLIPTPTLTPTLTLTLSTHLAHELWPGDAVPIEEHQMEDRVRLRRLDLDLLPPRRVKAL
eukprot:scaffold47977_cov40-Phaeocystis_antarctica.AAC.2